MKKPIFSLLFCLANLLLAIIVLCDVTQQVVFHRTDSTMHPVYLAGFALLFFWHSYNSGVKYYVAHKSGGDGEYSGHIPFAFLRLPMGVAALVLAVVCILSLIGVITITLQPVYTIFLAFFALFCTYDSFSGFIAERKKSAAND